MGKPCEVIHLDQWEHPCAHCGVNTRVEFLERHDAYDTVCCPDCWDATEAELHVASCVCRHCVARRAAIRARIELAQQRKREAERARLKAAGVIVGEGDEEDISWGEGNP
jgi:hypothetical protein